MGPAVLRFLILPAPLHRAPLSDTTTYLDRATQQLVARGMERHRSQDSSVRDYQAKLRYRVSFGFARRKWGDPIPAAVEEQDATWCGSFPMICASTCWAVAAPRSSRGSICRRPFRIPGSSRGRWVIRCASSAPARRPLVPRPIRWLPAPKLLPVRGGRLAEHHFGRPTNHHSQRHRNAQCSRRACHRQVSGSTPHGRHRALHVSLRRHRAVDAPDGDTPHDSAARVAPAALCRASSSSAPISSFRCRDRALDAVSGGDRGQGVGAVRCRLRSAV